MRGWVAVLPMLLVGLPAATARAEPVLRSGTTSADDAAPSPWSHLMSSSARASRTGGTGGFAAVLRNGSPRGNTAPATPTWAISQVRRSSSRDARQSLGTVTSAATVAHRILADAALAVSTGSSGFAPSAADSIASAFRLPRQSLDGEDEGGDDDVIGFSVIANPEPGTMALFGAGALGLGAFAWRRRRARAAAPKS